MANSVIFSPSARDQLDAIFDYIAEAASPAIAQRFTDAIVDHVGKLSDYPRRGTPRDDLVPGLRTISFRRRVTIAFGVDEDLVLVVGIYYGGQDYEAILRDD